MSATTISKYKNSNSAISSDNFPTFSRERVRKMRVPTSFVSGQSNLKLEGTVLILQILDALILKSKMETSIRLNESWSGLHLARESSAP